MLPAISHKLSPLFLPHGNCQFCRFDGPSAKAGPDVHLNLCSCPAFLKVQAEQLVCLQGVGGVVRFRLITSIFHSSSSLTTTSSASGYKMSARLFDCLGLQLLTEKAFHNLELVRGGVYFFDREVSGRAVKTAIEVGPTINLISEHSYFDHCWHGVVLNVGLLGLDPCHRLFGTLTNPSLSQLLQHTEEVVGRTPGKTLL